MAPNSELWGAGLPEGVSPPGCFFMDDKEWGEPVERHPATQAILKHFQYGHLPPDLAEVSVKCQLLAQTMVEVLPDGPELTAGLRKLLEAKDCFVRAALDKTP